MMNKDEISIGKYSLSPDKTAIMGILNITPDSFSDGGVFLSLDDAVRHARQMVKDGADIIDIGGESARPGSNPVSVFEEIKRVKPVIESLSDSIGVPLSIDTCKPEVAEECLRAGASMVNDITGMESKRMIQVVRKHGASVAIMHMKSRPKIMQKDPRYADVVMEIKTFLKERAALAKGEGIEGIFIDPGIGFGKTTQHNLKLISHLGEFRDLGFPILIGPSRKNFIGEINKLPVDERLDGTLASVAVCAMNGASVIRVHDVKQCARVLQIVDAIKRAE